jgi:ABC-type uncharacterized transport system permease subunit
MQALVPAGVGLFAGSTAAYLAALWTSKPGVLRAAHVLLGLTVLLWVGILAASVPHLAEGGVTRFYLGGSAIGLSGLYLVLVRRYPIAGLGSFVSALATLLAVFAMFAQRQNVTDPTLVDWLLRIHIALAFVGVTAFAFSTALSMVYLMQARMLKQKAKTELRRRLPPLDVLDRLALRGIVVGFPFYTVALLLGSAQAIRTEHLRGSYVLAIISWVIYGVVLQARLTAGWRGRRAAILTIFGLILALSVVAQYGFRSV